MSQGPAAAGRNPSVTIKAFALYELLVLVDHRLCGGAEDPGRGRGGSDVPEMTENLPDMTDSLLLLTRLLTSVAVIVPQPSDEVCELRELVLSVLVPRVGRGGDVGLDRPWRDGEPDGASSRSRIDGACMLDAAYSCCWWWWWWSPRRRRVGLGLFGCGSTFSLSRHSRFSCWMYKTESRREKV